ncbi:MAG: hypothetical protein FJX75_26415 [Armatimonadetes bacterium]|nr:hypothetical protein [Armatimonadota bacterium]
MRSLPILLHTMVLILPMAAYAQETTVPLPPGETPLSDIGVYTVAYQSYGGEVVTMPPSWTGHFVDPSGISYLPSEQVLGRSAILLHSPWRVPPGKVWVDYPLRLPDVKPIRLSFGIAMRPDVATPDKSDGVTFSAHLIADGQGIELIREHWAKAEWKDFRFDLSECAGRELTLRLQTEPGPANSPSWDYSYFGGAKITVGEGGGGRQEMLKRLMSAKAYQATKGASLVALSNRSDQGCAPSNLLPCKNAIAQDGDGYRFTYQGEDCRIVYRYEPKTGTLDDFTVQVDDTPAFQPTVGGGVTILPATTPVVDVGGIRKVRATRISLAKDGKSVEAVWGYYFAGQTCSVTWTFGILGKALTISAKCDEPVVTNFSLGGVGGAALRRTIAIPYMPADWSRGSVSYLSAQNAFVCRYLDWTVSHSSRCPQGESVYEPKTDGTRNPLVESGYVAVSPNVGEVLPNIPNPASPYLGLLGPRIMLDIWGHHEGTYAGDAENLRALKDNGVDHVAIIQHVWQRWGYDVKLPDHLPADPAYGGEEGMIEFGKAANECGYVWSLHENYIDLYPDAPSYDPTARVLFADGKPSPAWFNAGTGVQSFGLKCNRALGFAKQNSPIAHERYGTTAAYLDVHTCVPPWHQLDHEADQPMAAMALAKVKYDTELFQFERDTHGGPLFGEGANHFYWAGKVDGVEAQVSGGESHVPFLDLDLLKIHPQMVNHGMGYYERWFDEGYSAQYGTTVGTVEDIDKYRAQEMAYGHAGFIGHVSTDNVQWVAKEHHLMHPVQALYGTGKPTEIAYEIDGQFVPASIALAIGEQWRQRITYDSGLRLWVNWAKEPWVVEGRTLPQWGVLALGPNTEVTTSLVGGKLADYAECPEYLFADARTSFNMPYLQSPKAIEPKLADFAYLGEGKIRVTYQWVINDALDDDYNCFVHFTSPSVDSSRGGIVFQQDHGTPKPTSQWRPGETLTDGPYEITVPPDYDTYDLVIGLFKGPRVRLKGIDDGGSRILIGRLMLKRENGKITDITLGDLSADAAKQQASRADFTANLNPPGTWVDFGKVATDGSVKVNLRGDSLTVFPYPRDKAFKVALDTQRILPRVKIDLGKITVHALAAGTQTDMGAVPSQIEKGRVVFEVGTAGAGRYVVTW